jgi:hypothetical protein
VLIMQQAVRDVRVRCVGQWIGGSGDEVARARVCTDGFIRSCRAGLVAYCLSLRCQR